MTARACTAISAMKHATPGLDHERRFHPERPEVDAFLRAVRPFTVPLVYAREHPYSFTRTTYFDTEALALLGSREGGAASRLRLREYAGAADLAQPPVLTGTRFLELKVSTGERRTKTRCPVSQDEAEALLSGAPLPTWSPALLLLRQSAPAPVKPWVTAWYRRLTFVTHGAAVRITLDEDLAFAPPATPGGPVAPTDAFLRASSPLVEVKWMGRAPRWLERALEPLTRSESHGSKYEQAMRALLGGTLPLTGSH
ncbi:VTC domain-containing protein [Myxococcaceae bacterium GXIMD 01537]